MASDCEHPSLSPWRDLEQTLLRPGAWQGDGAMVEWIAAKAGGRVALKFGICPKLFYFSPLGLRELAKFCELLADQREREARQPSQIAANP